MIHIGYYAHHHGSGHCRQADKLVAQLNTLGQQVEVLLTVFTSMDETDYFFEHLADSQVVRLPPEDEHPKDILPGRAGDYWQPDCLHYSPVGNADIKARSLKLLTQIAEQNIELMIIDLSVEVAMLCRAASIPYLYMRLPGERDDMAHINTFQGAIGLLAAYPECLEVDDTPEWIRKKTLYLGFLQLPIYKSSESAIKKVEFISQLKQSYPDCTNELSVTNPIVTVIKGYGGHVQIDAYLFKLRSVMPQAFIISLGPINSGVRNLVNLAIEVPDTGPYMQHSDLLVMACGLNAIGEACQPTTIMTPLLVIPDQRPYREQEVMAVGLIACGRALGLEAFFAQNTHDLFTPHAEYNLPRLSDCQQKQLQKTQSTEFIVSLAQASNAKTWFYSWLLPKLAIAPVLSYQNESPELR